MLQIDGIGILICLSTCFKWKKLTEILCYEFFVSCYLETTFLFLTHLFKRHKNCSEVGLKDRWKLAPQESAIYIFQWQWHRKLYRKPIQKSFRKNGRVQIHRSFSKTNVTSVGFHPTISERNLPNIMYFSYEIVVVLRHI